jgi:hypothetical protein
MNPIKDSINGHTSFRREHMLTEIIYFFFDIGKLSTPNPISFNNCLDSVRTAPSRYTSMEKGRI